jgi:DnaK suppressor protein
MNEHEEIAKALKARLSELRTHLAKVDRELHKRLSADSEDQAIELENQEALEVIKKTETTEIHQIEAALKRISEGTYGTCAKVRRAYRPKTPEGAANSSYVHFLFGLIFKYEATTETAAIWIVSRSPAISWWRRARAGSISRPATCSGVSKCRRVRTTIAMYASGTAVNTARSARSSCRTRNGAAAYERRQNQDQLQKHSTAR